MEESLSRILLFILLTVFPGYSFAIENRIPGARSTALARAVVALSGEEALFHNQAGISGVPSLTFSLSYESTYLLKEHSLASLGIIVPTNKGIFGIMFYQFGTSVYRENKAGLVYSKKWGDKLAAALQFDYFSQRLPENSKTFTAVTFEAGVLYKCHDNWVWGIHIFNPIGIRMNYLSGKESIPCTIRLGCSWLISPWLTGCSELEKRAGDPLSLRTGIEFSPDPNFTIRAGVSGAPVKFTAGTGFRVGKFTCNIAWSYHGNLGYTPSIGISFSP
jgi:hypothetical protein